MISKFLCTCLSSVPLLMIHSLWLLLYKDSLFEYFFAWCDICGRLHSWGISFFNAESNPPQVFLLVCNLACTTLQETGQKESECHQSRDLHKPKSHKCYVQTFDRVSNILDVQLVSVECDGQHSLFSAFVSPHFIPHPGLVGVLCLTTSLNKQYNHSSPLLISSSPFYLLYWSIALSNYPSQAGKWSNCLECNYSGSLKGGHCVEVRLHNSETALFVLQKDNEGIWLATERLKYS